MDEGAAKQDSAVRIRQLSSRYGTRNVLSSVNLTVQKGEVYVVTGASGAGKSTLLNTIVGLVDGSADSLRVLGGAQVENNSQVGYMPQVTGLISSLTVKEMWECCAKLVDMDERETAQRITFMGDLLMLPKQMGQLCGTLSGGQKQRASLGMALISSPELLVLDEPMSGLDPLLRKNLWIHLKHLCARYRTTVIVATQFLELACEANHVGLVHDGFLLVQGTPAQLVQHWTGTAPAVTGRVQTQELSAACDLAVGKYEEIVGQGLRNALKRGDPDCWQTFKTAADDGAAAAETADVRTEEDSAEQDLPKLGEWQLGRQQDHNSKSGVRWNKCHGIYKTHTLTTFRHVFSVSVLLLLIMPVFDIGVYKMFVGRNIRRLEVGVYSEDSGYGDASNRTYLSEHTLKYFEHSNDYRIKHLNCTGQDGKKCARGYVDRNEVRAAVHFKKGYSKKAFEATDTQDDMKYSLFVDTAAPVMASQISEDMYEAFLEMERTVVKRRTRHVFDMVEEVYGNMRWRFSYVLIGGLVGYTSMVNGIINTLAEMTKREEEETHTRFRVAAISSLEFLLGNIWGLFAVNLPQGFALTTLCTLIGYSSSLTPLNYVALVVSCWSLYSVGIMLSVLCGMIVKRQYDALLVLIAVQTPLMVLCGGLWPVEAQPYSIRWFTVLLPTTWGVSTYQSFLLKSDEAGLRNFMGLMVCCWGWNLVFFFSSLYLNSRKTKTVELAR